MKAGLESHPCDCAEATVVDILMQLLDLVDLWSTVLRPAFSYSAPFLFPFIRAVDGISAYGIAKPIPWLDPQLGTP